MPTTYVDYNPATSDQITNGFEIPFDYLEDEHVIVEVNGVQNTNTELTTGTPVKIKITSGPGSAGDIVRVRRKSQPDTDLVDFENGSILTESELDRAYRHNRYLAEEIAELNDASLQEEEGGTDWDAKTKKIKNLGTPTLTADATTKQYVDDKVSQASTGTTQPPEKWVFSGTAGANTTYSVTGAEINHDTAYDVSIDGAVQEPTTDYTVDPDTDTLTIVPTLSGGEDIVVIERGFGIATSTLADGSVTAAKISSTDSTFKISGGDVTVGNNLSVGTSPEAGYKVTIDGDLFIKDTGDDTPVAIFQGDLGSIIQLKDTATTGSDNGVYNIGSLDGAFSIGAVNDDGSGRTTLLSLQAKGPVNGATLRIPPITVNDLGSVETGFTPAEGMIAYVSNGDAGSPCLAVFDGSTFKVVSLGATISSS